MVFTFIAVLRVHSSKHGKKAEVRSVSIGFHGATKKDSKTKNKTKQKGQKSDLSVMDFMEQQRNTAKKQKTKTKKGQKSDLSVMDFTEQQT